MPGFTRSATVRAREQGLVEGYRLNVAREQQASVSECGPSVVNSRRA